MDPQSQPQATPSQTPAMPPQKPVSPTQQFIYEEKQNNHKSFFAIIMVLILFIITLGGIYFFKQQNNQSSLALPIVKTSPQPTTTTIQPTTSKSIVTSLPTDVTNNNLLDDNYFSYVPTNNFFYLKRNTFKVASFGIDPQSQPVNIFLTLPINSKILDATYVRKANGRLDLAIVNINNQEYSISGPKYAHIPLCPWHEEERAKTNCSETTEEIIQQSNENTIGYKALIITKDKDGIFALTALEKELEVNSSDYQVGGLVIFKDKEVRKKFTREEIETWKETLGKVELEIIQ